MNETDPVSAPYLWQPGASSIVLVLVIAGVLSGLLTFLRSENIPSRMGWRSLFSRMLEALLAAFCVPLFLSLTSSNLLRTAQTDSMDLLVIGGLGIVAALSAQVFVDDLRSALKIAKDAKATADSAKEGVTQNSDDLKETKRVVQGLESEISEPDDDGEVAAKALTQEEGRHAADAVALDPQHKEILRALAFSKWKRRSVKGLSNDVDIDPGTIYPILEDLVSKGLVERHNQTATQKSVRYSATYKGIRLVWDNPPPTPNLQD